MLRIAYGPDKLSTNGEGMQIYGSML